MIDGRTVHKGGTDPFSREDVPNGDLLPTGDRKQCAVLADVQIHLQTSAAHCDRRIGLARRAEVPDRRLSIPAETDQHFPVVGESHV